MIDVSLSATNLFQDCPQAYSFRYIDGLTRKERDAARLTGIILHEYLSRYYGALKQLGADAVVSTDVTGIDATRLHETALSETVTLFKPQVEAEYRAAWEAGDEQRSLVWIGLLEKICRIAHRYFRTRGKDDALRYSVLVVEDRIFAKLAPGIRNNSVIDLITSDRETGRTALWEHKTTGSVPDADVRLTDVQTVLYRRLAEQQYGIHIDQVRWNYLRTKEPVVPERLKSGGLSKDKRLDSTWDVYAETLWICGLRDTGYEDVRERLLNAEEEVFFRRIDLPFLADADVLLANYRQVARSVQQRRRAWAAGKAQPERHLGYGCRRCDYHDICKAVIMGGDAADVIRIKYKRRGESETEVRVTDESAQSTHTVSEWNHEWDDAFAALIIDDAAVGVAE